MGRGLRHIILSRIQNGKYRMTYHAQMERFADAIEMEAIESALISGDVIEDYPEDKRGHSCLVCGLVEEQPIHIVVGGLEIDDEVLVIITVYRPVEEEWESDWKTRRTR
jgi:hypothetical protein